MKCQVPPITCRVSRITHHASRITHHPSPVTPRSAFSLIEIMVTVALLSFIVLGLLAMFTQTKRAFTSSMTQTDVMESGRAVIEMIARELEQLTPGHVNNGNYRCTNFFAELSPGFNRAPLANSSECILLQGMPGTAVGAVARWPQLSVSGSACGAGTAAFAESS